MVCSTCYEVRQPQDFVRASIDKMAVPWSRPEANDQFITGSVLITESSTSDDWVYIVTESLYPITTEN